MNYKSIFLVFLFITNSNNAMFFTLGCPTEEEYFTANLDSLSAAEASLSIASHAKKGSSYSELWHMIQSTTNHFKETKNFTYFEETIPAKAANMHLTKEQSTTLHQALKNIKDAKEARLREEEDSSDSCVIS